MRARLMLTGTALAATMLVGGAATSQAAATPSGNSTFSTQAPAGAAGWVFMGEYSKADCIDLRDSYAGQAKCVKNAGGLWDLYIKV